MEQYIEFAGNHWGLFLALGVVLGLLTHNLLLGSKGSLGPLDAIEKINRDNAVIVDVRPAADFSTGHIINAVNMPSNGFAKQMSTLEKYKDRPIIISCRSGSQSSHACGQLRKNGFEAVYNLRGGLLAWQNANLPLTRRK